MEERWGGQIEKYHKETIKEYHDVSNSKKVMDRLENKKCLFRNLYLRKISANLEVIFTTKQLT